MLLGSTPLECTPSEGETTVPVAGAADGDVSAVLTGMGWAVGSDVGSGTGSDAGAGSGFAGAGSAPATNDSTSGLPLSFDV